MGGGIEAVGATPVDIGIDLVLEFAAEVRHHQIEMTVAIEVCRRHRAGADTDEAVALGRILEMPVGTLQIDVQWQRPARVVMVDPGRGKNQVQASVAVDV